MSPKSYIKWLGKLFFVLAFKDLSFTIHHANIQTLLLEMYKIKNNVSEGCLKDLSSAVNDN